MKLRSLLLGSAAVAGLTTGGYAADATLTSLNTCDALGISGITVSSDATCVQISGGVDYRFRYGDYRADPDWVAARSFDGTVDFFRSDSAANGASRDWETRTRAWLQVTASQDTSFGKASAVIGIRQIDEWRTRNQGFTAPVGLPAGQYSVAGGDNTGGAKIDQAYVAVGSSTVLMAGLRRSTIANGGSIANSGDDTPFSYLFVADTIDGGGVLINNDDFRFGGVSLQAVTDLGNGLSAAVGLENMASESGAPFLTNTTGAGVTYASTNGDTDQSIANARSAADQAGTLIGVLQYKGDNITAHVTGVAFGVLDGSVSDFAVHAGATGTFDMISVVGAVGYESNYKNLGYAVLHALASAQATFDMFKLAVSGEVANWTGATDTTIGGKVTVAVADGVSLNLDGSWFHSGHSGQNTTRVVAGGSLAVTETLTLNAAVGGYFGTGDQLGAASQPADGNILIGSLGVVWAPGPHTSAGASVEVHDDGGWRTQVDASQSF